MSSDICPENFKLIYDEFKSYQNAALDTAREFHRVCEKNSVKYQLAFGSLLGIVRDNGQIPWDYDVDVLVPYNEKEKLIKALEKDLNTNFYFYCPEVDKKCRHFLLRLAPRKYDTKLREIFEKNMRRFFQWRYYKLVKIKDLKNIKIKRRLKIIAFKVCLLPVGLQSINRKMKEVCEMYSETDSLFSVPLIAVYKNIPFETKELWDTHIVDSSEGSFRITKHADKILTILYKDYNRIFPLKNRLSEMAKFYKIISGKTMNLQTEGDSGRYYAKK